MHYILYLTYIGFIAATLPSCEVDELGSRYETHEGSGTFDKKTSVIDDSNSANDGEAIPSSENDREPPLNRGNTTREPSSYDENQQEEGGHQSTLEVESIELDPGQNVEGIAISFTVSLSEASHTPQTFTWMLRQEPHPPSGDPNVEDFIQMEGTLTFASGASEASIKINPISDFTKEGTETFRIQIQGKSPANIASLPFLLHDGKLYKKGLVSTGEKHSCSIKEGALFCWGDNEDGQLGLGNDQQQSSATSIPDMSRDLEYVEARSNHTCAVQSSIVSCWGRNDLGQLGDNTTNRRRSPVVIKSTANNITQVSTGNEHTCAISGGNLYCWGSNEFGELGIGSFEQKLVPERVILPEGGITDVALGNSHTCIIRNKAVYCWGRNNFGQLGVGTTEQSSTPVPILELADQVEMIASSGFQTCAIKNHELFCWGDNSSGQLGIGISGGQFLSPQSTSLIDVIGIALGDEHGCAINSDRPYCWGRGIEGQLGDSSSENVSEPVAIDVFGERVISIAVGRFHTCMRGISKTMCWGSGANGQVGDGSRRNRSSPRSVKFDRQ